MIPKVLFCCFIVVQYCTWYNVLYDSREVHECPSQNWLRSVSIFDFPSNTALHCSSSRIMADKKFSNLPNVFGKKLLDDCERPACDDILAGMKASMSRLQSSDSATPGAASECPPNSPQLGNSSWTLLHSMVGCLACIQFSRISPL